MEHTIRATDLARNLGGVLARVRYRNDSFVVERNSVRVARLAPLSSTAPTAMVGEALDVWLSGAAADPGFADDLAAIRASHRPPDGID